MIRVECPHCQRRYRTKLEAIGRTAICTQCSESFKIGEARPPFEWKPTDIAEDSWIGVEPPKEKEELKHCIMCEAPMQPGSVVCPACGANQVTGLIHRAKPKVPEAKVAIWATLPVRMVLLLAAVIAVGAGTMYTVQSLSRSAAETTEQLVHQRTVREAAKYLRDQHDEATFSQRFDGRVNDDNLSIFVRNFDDSDHNVRRAAVLLIAYSTVTQLEPIVSKARPAGDNANAQEQKTAIQTLEAIGLQRILDLSTHDSPDIRQSAAEALCLLADIDCDNETIRQLAETLDRSQKTTTLNDLCRRWPQATGQFAVIVHETEAPFDMFIEQVGQRFFMQIKSVEFQSPAGGQRRFEIPIERWCHATDTTFDTSSIRDAIAGSVQLESPYGEGWDGLITVTAKRELSGTLPGFLPVGPLERGQTVQAKIRLERR